MSNTIQVKRCPKCGGEIPAEAPQGLCPKCLLLQASIPTESGKGASAKSAPPAYEALAAAFPQLEILELIGQGGMGFVFKARQPKLDRFVALKILPQSLAADPAFAERFAREGRMLARLNHPNIVTIHDFGQAGGFFYLLMEFVDGVNLRQAMKVGRFTPAQALAVVPKICEALQFAHNEGILHRDIKPENILLDAKGRVKIADFGIAKLVGEPRAGGTLTGNGAALGTPHYMAPEQIEHPQDVDQRADIYSLGVVFYEMLTGELPLGRFAPPSQKSSADPRLDDVVLRSLEKERQLRQPSADEVKTQVERITNTPAPKAAGDWKASSLSDIRILREIGGSFSRVFVGVMAGGAAIILILIIYALVLRMSSRPQLPTATQADSAATASTMVIDYEPARLNLPVNEIKSNFMAWSFKCLVPADCLAQMALVFWTNGAPQILMSGYVKVGKSSVILESMYVGCNSVESSPHGGTNVMQWNFSAGFGYTRSHWVSNQPPYRRLEVAQQRMFLHSGRQLVIPLVDFAQSNRLATNERSGVELRVLLQALQGPAVLTLPDQFDRTNYIAGFGFPGTMEETLDKIKKWPTDP